jgi:hypothetical protein
MEKGQLDQVMSFFFGRYLACAFVLWRTLLLFAETSDMGPFVSCIKAVATGGPAMEEWFVAL